ncbi:TonB-dependent receptor [Pontixanthobacter sp. CEM42]|uniref:TonB-dependent receptor n=1 Tax=Pontixanthobacter sp. CEM42 TaxID=2792077 RepID=UPI001AE0E3CD|nr:TonB-dependent receptor [Pontixanthobacter sp. CEM42]
MKLRNLSLCTLPLMALALPQTLSAQEAETTEEGQPKDPHDRGEILVTAEGLEQLDFIAGQTTLGPDEIQRNLNGQLGEVLAKVPGVSATSFGPGASRPILRGQDGERVRILIDGLGTADVANTSADHATTIDPLTVDRIEVLRGPAALLYGSQAIGGVVNVIDKRIPIAVPENGIHVDALLAGDTASDLRSGGISLDAGLGDSFVVHVDGSYRETGNLEIPGFQVTDALRTDLLGDAAEEEEEGELEEAEELREAANQFGFVPNTSTETYTFNGGIGVILGESSFGASAGYYDTFYGIPGNPEGGHHHGEEEGEEEEEEEGEETVSIGLEQWRFDFRGDIALGGGFFERLKIRGGYSDYTHTEFEGTEVGTVFDTETFEARAELIQSGSGVFGAQFTSRDFQAVGEEAFVAPNETTQIGIFTAQEFDVGNVQIEGAARYENVSVDSDPLGLERNFNLFSGALSAVVGSENDIRFGITGSRSERAPAGEELFANGPHIATQTFEIGDPNLDVESAWGLETFIRGETGDVSFGASIYYQQFDNYIYLSPTDQEEDDLPVFVFLQDDARFFGFEGELMLPVVKQDGFTISADLRASYVDAQINDGSNVPRIPPLSLLGAVIAETGPFEARAEVQHFGKQDDVAEFETETAAFTFVNAAIAWRPLKNRDNVTVLLQADNIFDVEGRRHTSFTKEFLPLAGRNFKVSVRTSF